jgi:hypothetical protein
MLQLFFQPARSHKRTLSPHLRRESVFRQDDFDLSSLRFQLFELLWTGIKLLLGLWGFEPGVEGRIVRQREL